MCEVNYQTSVHKRIFLDFDHKDCSQCQQYTLLMEIKENQIGKLKAEHATATEKITALQNNLKIKESKLSELEAQTMKDEAIIKKNSNELEKFEQTIALLKKELNELRITKNDKMEEPNNNLTENINIVNTAPQS